MIKSISHKLTLIIIVLVTLLLLGSMLFMSYYFEDYYTSTKKNALADNLEIFRDENYQTPDEFVEAINSFETNNFTKLFIFSKDGILQYMAYGGTKIDSDSIEIINRFFTDLNRDPSLAVNILENQKIISREYSRTDGSIKYFLTASSIKLADTDDIIAISISSMLPINESANTIKNFFIYVFIGGFIVVVILAIFISNTVTKPIKRLTANAKELSKLNFEVTISKKSNDELGELSESLSTLSTNLKSSLNELSEKNKLLEEDIEKSQRMENQRKNFIRDISHELKTPITLIQGYTEGLIDGIGEDNKEEYLSIILDETRNMEKLVKDMIELSYSESNAFKLELADVNLSKTLGDSLMPFVEVNSKEYQFEYEITRNVHVNADQIKLATALRNIIKNAVSYTDLEQDKHGTINVSLKEENQKMVLKIKNSPAHIDEDELKNIWIQFYKKDKSRQRKNGSSGLGLSIIKNILEKHNLAFSIQNEDNGVVFSIEFEEYRIEKSKMKN